MFNHYTSTVLLSGANDTRKRHITVYANVRTSSPFQGFVKILDPVIHRNGAVYYDVEFTPDSSGPWWYFSLSPCLPVDGAVIASVIRIGPKNALTILKLSTCGLIKRRNLLSKSVELLTFYKGREIDNVDSEGQPPATLQQQEPSLDLPVPKPTLALEDSIASLLKHRGI